MKSSRIFLQLREMVESMWKMAPPYITGVENVDGGSLSDGRLPGTSIKFGPFDGGVAEFHRHLRTGIEKHDDSEIKQLI